MGLKLNKLACDIELVKVFFFCCRFRLNSGWSFHSSGPARKTSTKADISVTEQEIIRNVLERSEKIREVEEERIG